MGGGWGPEKGEHKGGERKGGGETLKVRRGDYSGPRIGELQSPVSKVLAIHSEGRGELPNWSTGLDHGLRQGVEKKE